MYVTNEMHHFVYCITDNKFLKILKGYIKKETYFIFPSFCCNTMMKLEACIISFQEVIPWMSAPNIEAFFFFF